MRQQPGRGTIEEYAGPLGSGPAEPVEPACQAKSNPGLGDIAVAEMQPNVGGMFPPLFASPISRQTVQLRNVQLIGERLHDCERNRYGIIEKRPEITHGR